VNDLKKIIMKFGGASVASGENIRHIANLIANYVGQGYKVVTVVSALEGITDQLIEMAEQARKGNSDHIYEFRQKIFERHLTAARKAIENKSIREEVEQILKTTTDELEKVLTGIIYVGELTPKSKDYVISFGERLSMPTVWGALQNLKLNAQYYSGGEIGIVTDSNFGEALPLMNVTKHQVREKIEPLLDKGMVPVVTGYIAATQDGITTTLGRGGSDYTATIIGAALAADEIWIWTDVDGLMTSDPKIVPSAKMLPELSFQEAIEMAIFGAKAMHPRALQPAVEENIPVRIRNAFKPENPGTLIIKEQRIKPGNVVKSIALIKDVAMINVTGAGMVGAPGSYAKIFEVLGKNNINIIMISIAASEANISLATRRGLLQKAVSTLEIAFLGRGLVSEVTAEDDVCIVAVVGAGMKGTVGVASRIFTAIARRGINIRMIAQGSSELNISFIVKESDGEETVRAIHEEFRLDKI
jgi:aspartate kinase